MAAIPVAWMKEAELFNELTILADDLYIRDEDTKEWGLKYPGY